MNFCEYCGFTRRVLRAFVRYTTKERDVLLCRKCCLTKVGYVWTEGKQVKELSR